MYELRLLLVSLNLIASFISLLVAYLGVSISRQDGLLQVLVESGREKDKLLRQMGDAAMANGSSHDAVTFKSQAVELEKLRSEVLALRRSSRRRSSGKYLLLSLLNMSS